MTNKRQNKILYSIWFEKEELGDFLDAIKVEDKDFVFELINNIIKRKDFYKK